MFWLDLTLFWMFPLHMIHQSTLINKLPLASNTLKDWRHVTSLLVLVTALVSTRALLSQLLESLCASILILINSLVALRLGSCAIWLLSWSLPVLRSLILVVIVSSSHRLLSIVVLSVVSSLSFCVKMPLRALVFLNLILGVEKLITGHNVVVCQELRLKLAEVDMVFLELMLVELAQRVVAVTALGAVILLFSALFFQNTLVLLM